MTKYRKMPILHHISANSHTCGTDAKTFAGSMNSLAFQKLGGGVQIFGPNFEKNFQF